MANEVEDFLSAVKGEEKIDSLPVESKESDPLSNLAGTTESKGEEEDEDKLPFHKNPKLQRYIEKEIGKRIKDLQPSERETFIREVGGEESDELTDTLVEIIGNDTPQKVAAVKKFRAQLEGLEERGAERALQQIMEASEAESEAEVEAMDELTTGFDSVEEEFGVDITSNSQAAKKERNDFIDFIKQISPKDGNGDVIQYPDIPEAYRVFQGSRKPAENKRAKDIASRSMTRSSDASNAPSTGRTWKDVDRIFSKLKN